MTLAIESEIRAFVTESFMYGDASAAIGRDDSLIENGLVDSTGVLELVAFVEERFGIEVADADIVPANFDSLARIGAFVAAKSPGLAAVA